MDNEVVGTAWFIVCIDRFLPDNSDGLDPRMDRDKPVLIILFLISELVLASHKVEEKTYAHDWERLALAFALAEFVFLGYFRVILWGLHRDEGFKITINGSIVRK